MEKCAVKIEADFEKKHVLEDLEMQQETTKPSSFCFESVVKEEIILEAEEYVPPEEEGNEDQLLTDSTQMDTNAVMFCDECNKSFTNPTLFRTHLYRHRVIREGKHTCSICDKRCRNKTALTIHIQGVHLSSKLIKPMAGKNENIEESNKPNFAKAATNVRGNFKCTECDERFEFQFQQQNHSRRHRILNQELFKCEECNKAFASPQEFKSHMQRAHEKHAINSSKISVKEEDGVFSCSKCNKTFEQRYLCQRHILRHLALLKEKVFPCVECPKKFITEKYLANHVAWHKAVSEIVKCDVCNKRFKNKHQLKRHIQRHDAMKEGKFECKECNQRYATKRQLVEHAKKHESGMTMPTLPAPIVIARNNHSAFKCPDCGKVFTFQRVYNRHAQKHLNLKNGTYKCDICEKICLSDNNLVTHLLRHQAGVIKPSEPRELPFECTQCDKKFAKNHLLARHTKIHEAIEKGLYKCKICGKYLGSIGSLTTHELAHENNITKAEYKCAECDRTYTRRDIYSTHIRTVHGGNKRKRSHSETTEC